MATFVYDAERGMMVDKETGAPMVEGPWEPVTPRLWSDLEGYRSPIDGRWVEGRRARRYDLESNGCVDANELRTEKKLKNKRFIEKRGLQHLAE